MRFGIRSPFYRKPLPPLPQRRYWHYDYIIHTPVGFRPTHARVRLEFDLTGRQSALLGEVMQGVIDREKV